MFNNWGKQFSVVIALLVLMSVLFPYTAAPVSAQVIQDIECGTHRGLTPSGFYTDLYLLDLSSAAGPIRLTLYAAKSDPAAAGLEPVNFWQNAKLIGVKLYDSNRNPVTPESRVMKGRGGDIFINPFAGDTYIVDPGVYYIEVYASTVAQYDLVVGCSGFVDLVLPNEDFIAAHTETVPVRHPDDPYPCPGGPLGLCVDGLAFVGEGDIQMTITTNLPGEVMIFSAEFIDMGEELTYDPESFSEVDQFEIEEVTQLETTLDSNLIYFIFVGNEDSPVFFSIILNE